jgi:hypothetical protein
MSLICNPEAVGWKKNNAPGIRCVEQSNGQMWLVGWPDDLGAIPSQADLDQWAGEYAAFKAVPQSVTPLQARRALNLAGLRSTIEAWVEQQDQETQDAWRYANEIRRDNAVLAAAASVLEMTDAQIDALFVAAAAL